MNIFKDLLFVSGAILEPQQLEPSLTAAIEAELALESEKEEKKSA